MWQLSLFCLESGVNDVDLSPANLEQTKKFAKLVKQLDEKKQQALLLIIKGSAVLSGVEKDVLL